MPRQHPSDFHRYAPIDATVTQKNTRDQLKDEFDVRTITICSTCTKDTFTCGTKETFDSLDAARRKCVRQIGTLDS